LGRYARKHLRQQTSVRGFGGESRFGHESADRPENSQVIKAFVLVSLEDAVHNQKIAAHIIPEKMRDGWNIA